MPQLSPPCLWNVLKGWSWEDKRVLYPVGWHRSCAWFPGQFLDWGCSVCFPGVPGSAARCPLVFHSIPPGSSGLLPKLPPCEHFSRLLGQTWHLLNLLSFCPLTPEVFFLLSPTSQVIHSKPGSVDFMSNYPLCSLFHPISVLVKPPQGSPFSCLSPSHCSWEGSSSANPMVQLRAGTLFQHVL